MGLKISLINYETVSKQRKNINTILLFHPQQPFFLTVLLSVVMGLSGWGEEPPPVLLLSLFEFFGPFRKPSDYINNLGTD
jgi:hypothetical protein